MKKTGIIGALFSLAVVVLLAGVISYVGTIRDSRESVELEANSNTEPNTEVSINNTKPVYETVEEKDENVSEPKKDVEKIEEKKTVPEEKEVFLESEDYAPVSSVVTNDPSFEYPVIGEIVMDYSIDSAIFDVTLEQYRTNDSISISVAKGEDVLSSAEGTVSNIYTDIENGTTVVIDHENGWQTTYSQLDKNTAVSKGDTVLGGQKIGTVSSPSTYSVALGDHIDFAVAKNGETVDPKTVLVD